MHRKIAMAALLGGLAAGLGCQHIAGKSDCGYNPADYPIGPPTPPYPSALAPVLTPEKIPSSIFKTGAESSGTIDSNRLEKTPPAVPGSY